MSGSAPVGPYGAHVPSSTTGGFFKLDKLEEPPPVTVICLGSVFLFVGTNQIKL
jgi:hypothetical protein